MNKIDLDVLYNIALKVLKWIATVPFKLLKWLFTRSK